jgi:TRAP-type uncharacterized transport system fused permease subunit
MLTTFVIPFAFVYYPSLMSFPNLSWDVLIPIVTCLLLQWTVSIACYGHFLRDQSYTERWGWGVVSFAGYAGLCTHGSTWNLIFVALMLVMGGYVYFTRDKVIHAAERERQRVKSQVVAEPDLPLEGRYE